MDSWLVLGYVVGGILSAVCLLFTYCILKIKSLRATFDHIPGPKVQSFLFGHAKEIQQCWMKEGNSACLQYKWNKEHGSTFVIHILHTPWVVTTCPEAIKEVLVSGKHVKPARNYTSIAYVYGQRFLGRGIVTEVNTEAWLNRRLILNPAFHRKYLRTMISEMNLCAEDMITSLSQFADGTTEVQLGGFLARATLDVIGKVSFNKDINSVQNAESPLPKAIFTALYGFSHSVLDVFWWLKPWERQDFKQETRDACLFIRKTCLGWLDERREQIKRGEGVPDDILTQVLNAHGLNGKSTEMDMESVEVILDDFVTMFVAGQETTANATSFALLELGRNPEVLKKLKAEVDKVLGGRTEITSDDLSRLEYTGMVFKEALRLYPVAPVTFRELYRDTVIDGYQVPKGTIVQVNFFSASRNPEYFDDPLEFRPERFSKEGNRHNTYAFTPFSLGPRNCIGQNLAQMEGKVLLAKFAQRFNFHLDMTQSFDILEATTLRPKDGVKCTLTPRSEEK